MNRTTLVDDPRTGRSQTACAILKNKMELTLGSRDTSSPEGECTEAGSITSTREAKQL